MINLHRFDLLTLRLYVAVVDAGSLTAGSRTLGLSLAAASKRVAELERAAGVALVTRTTRSVRLTEAGRAMGLVDDARWDAFSRKRDAVSRETERLKSTWVNPRIVTPEESERVLGKSIEREYNLFDLLRRPDVGYGKLMSLNEGRYASADVQPDVLGDLSASVVEQVEIAAKYAGYIDRQKDEVQRAAHFENLRLPAELDYMQVPALSFEVRQSLQKHRPETLGQASRMSGVTPAAISLLMVHLKKGGFRGFAPDVTDAKGEEASA